MPSDNPDDPRGDPAFKLVPLNLGTTPMSHTLWTSVYLWLRYYRDGTWNGNDPLVPVSSDVAMVYHLNGVWFHLCHPKIIYRAITNLHRRYLYRHSYTVQPLADGIPLPLRYGRAPKVRRYSVELYSAEGRTIAPTTGRSPTEGNFKVVINGVYHGDFFTNIKNGILYNSYRNEMKHTQCKSYDCKKVLTPAERVQLQILRIGA